MTENGGHKLFEVSAALRGLELLGANAKTLAAAGEKARALEQVGERAKILSEKVAKANAIEQAEAIAAGASGTSEEQQSEKKACSNSLFTESPKDSMSRVAHILGLLQELMCRNQDGRLALSEESTYGLYLVFELLIRGIREVEEAALT